MKNYVYAFLDPRKPGVYMYGSIMFLHEPFYIGKGRGKRDIDFNGRRNSHTKNKIKAIRFKYGSDPISVRVFDYLNNKTAYKLENHLIVLIGRIDLNTGPLTNMSDGGDGVYNLGPETRKRISKTMKDQIRKGNLKVHKRVYTDEERKIYSERAKKRHKEGTFGMKGKTHSGGSKISKALKGIPKSKSHKKKIKENHAKYWLGKKGPAGMKGKKQTENQKSKVSKALKGKPLSKEHREKIKKNHWSRQQTRDEHRRKISESLKGRSLSKEHRENIKKNHWSKQSIRERQV